MFPTFLSLGMSPMLLHRQIKGEPKMNRGKRDGKGRPSDDPKVDGTGIPCSSAHCMN
jgi:hypothetical protein